MPAAKSVAGDATNNPFIKQLASSNRGVRDRALSSLRTYLHRKAPFTQLDCLKLWKGLFFCMWMSDKPRNQQQLARDLAGLVDVIDRANIVAWFEAFWITLSREWAGVDALRMDKYLYLLRCYVNRGFDMLAKTGWEDEELMRGYLDVMQKTPLSTRDPKVLNGIRYHVIDIYVDELDKVDKQRDAPIALLLKPLRLLSKESMTKPVRQRALDALQDERLKQWDDGTANGEHQKVHDESNGQNRDEEDEEFAGFED